MENKVAAYNITDTTEMPYKQTISNKIVNVLPKKGDGKVNVKQQNAQIVGNTIYNVAEDLGFSKNKAGVLMGGGTVDIDNPKFSLALNKLGYRIKEVYDGSVLVQVNGGTKTAEILDGEDMDAFILKLTGNEGVSKNDAFKVLKSVKSYFVTPDTSLDYGTMIENEPTRGFGGFELTADQFN
jgi:hypothetical protein